MINPQAVLAHAANFDESLWLIIKSLLKANTDLQKSDLDYQTKQARFAVEVEASLIMLDACLNASANTLIKAERGAA